LTGAWQADAPPTRFATDSSLAFLARRLRLLGYDVLELGGARLEEVLEVAGREGRAVLTTSARHPRRYAAVRVFQVPRQAAAALRDLSLAHAPSGPPFGRCAECNTVLRRRHPLEASGEVPGSVLRRARALSFCPGCGRWYWEGSHVTRLRQWLEEALGRALPPSQEGSGETG
jgi:uncharacterized protein with PIN domain